MITTADSLEASDLIPKGLGPIPLVKVLKYSSSLRTSVLFSPWIHKGSPAWAILISSSIAATATSTIIGLSASVGPVTAPRRAVAPNISPTKPECAP